jgi:hypothetical protein
VSLLLLAVSVSRAGVAVDADSLGVVAKYPIFKLGSQWETDLQLLNNEEDPAAVSITMRNQAGEVLGKMAGRASIEPSELRDYREATWLKEVSTLDV